MTTNSNSGPGKTRHLNDIAACCEAMGMRVICVNAAERDFWLSASQQSAPALDGKAGISQHIMQRQRGHPVAAPADVAGLRRHQPAAAADHRLAPLIS